MQLIEVHCIDSELADSSVTSPEDVRYRDRSAGLRWWRESATTFVWKLDSQSEGERRGRDQVGYATAPNALIDRGCQRTAKEKDG